MKRRRLLMITLLVGSAVLVAPGSPLAFAHGGPPPWAHGRDHQDHGRKKGWRDNRGQRRKWERDREGRYRFGDNDRRAVIAYFRRHRDDRRFREDWRDRGDDYPTVAYGYVIEPRYRPYCRPLPVVLLREMPPPPPGLRYFLFGGNVVLVDNGYRVQDFIHIGFNFGN